MLFVLEHAVHTFFAINLKKKIDMGSTEQSNFWIVEIFYFSKNVFYDRFKILIAVVHFRFVQHYVLP